MSEPRLQDEAIRVRMVARRAALGISQRELARRVGVSKTAISEWEKGTKPVRTVIIPALAQSLQVSEHWLKTGYGEKDAKTSQLDETARRILSQCGGNEEMARVVMSATIEEAELLYLVRHMPAKDRETMKILARRYSSAEVVYGVVETPADTQMRKED